MASLHHGTAPQAGSVFYILLQNTIGSYVYGKYIVIKLDLHLGQLLHIPIWVSGMSRPSPLLLRRVILQSSRRRLSICAAPIQFDFARIIKSQSNYLVKSFISESFFVVAASFLRRIPSEIEAAFSVLACSTMRKRKAKMNKHKLKKRRKKMRMNTKVSRG